MNQFDILDPHLQFVAKIKHYAPRAPLNSVVLFLGMSGVGKSTLVNVLADLRPHKIQKNGLSILQFNEDAVCQVSSQFQSCTNIPNQILKGETVFFDMPGFSDSRGFWKKMQNLGYTNSVILKSQTVKLFWVISYQDLLDTKLVKMLAGLQQIQLLFREPTLDKSYQGLSQLAFQKVSEGQQIQVIINKVQSTQKALSRWRYFKEVLEEHKIKVRFRFNPIIVKDCQINCEQFTKAVIQACDRLLDSKSFLDKPYYRIDQSTLFNLNRFLQSMKLHLEKRFSQLNCDQLTEEVQALIEKVPPCLAQWNLKQIEGIQTFAWEDLQSAINFIFFYESSIPQLKKSLVSTLPLRKKLLLCLKISKQEYEQRYSRLLHQEDQFRQVDKRRQQEFDSRFQIQARKIGVTGASSLFFRVVKSVLFLVNFGFLYRMAVM